MKRSFIYFFHSEAMEDTLCFNFPWIKDLCFKNVIKISINDLMSFSGVNVMGFD